MSSNLRKRPSGKTSFSTRKRGNGSAKAQFGGIRVKGCQSYLTVSTGTATGTVPFTAGTLSYAILNPVMIGGNLGAFAQLYSRWRVNSMKIEFIPDCANTGLLALAYVPDGDEASDTLNPTFLQISEIKPSLLVPIGEGANVKRSSLRIPKTLGSEWLYCDADNSSNTFKERFDAAGIIYGQFNVQPIATPQRIGTIRLTWDLSFRGQKFTEALTRMSDSCRENFTPSSRLYDHCQLQDIKRSKRSLERKDEKSNKNYKIENYKNDLKNEVKDDFDLDEDYKQFRLEKSGMTPKLSLTTLSRLTTKS